MGQYAHRKRNSQRRSKQCSPIIRGREPTVPYLALFEDVGYLSGRFAHPDNRIRRFRKHGSRIQYHRIRP